MSFSCDRRPKKKKSADDRRPTKEEMQQLFIFVGFLGVPALRMTFTVHPFLKPTELGQPHTVLRVSWLKERGPNPGATASESVVFQKRLHLERQRLLRVIRVSRVRVASIRCRRECR